jgi:putative membrane protein
MPSEIAAAGEFRRHPSSILFGIAAVAKRLVLPWLVAFVASGGRRSADTWVLLFVVPAMVVAVLDYLLVRYAMGPEGLVVRRGVVYRNVRHVPYARIQNIDLRQNPVHRWLGVAEVTIQTASGEEAEARLRVLSLAAVETLRRRVFAGRAAAAPEAAIAEAPRHTILALGPRQVTIFGLLHGRGWVVAAAAAGLAFQWLYPDDAEFWSSKPWETLPSFEAGLTAGLWAALLLMLLLLLLRVLSVGWAFASLAGFRLERSGEDLRTTGGLLTRRQATIPRHRIQVLTIEEGVLPRAFDRVLVQADTAGGAHEGGEGGEASRAWIAPVLERAALPELLAEVVPGIELAGATWRPISARAFRRVARKRLLRCVVLGGALALALGPAGWLAGGLLLPFALVSAWVRVRTTAWATLPRALAVRSGWWTRRTRLVRYSKMQVVSTRASWFDRRARMAHVGVDTAAPRAAEIVVPWLEREDAQALARSLAEAAEKTRFKW